MKIILVLASFLLSSCAAVAPLDVDDFRNIAELSDEMAKSYTPGVMKLTTYAGMNTSKHETDEFISVTFKVKGELDEREKIQKTYQAYCRNLQGDFKKEDLGLFPSVRYLFCQKGNESVLFTIVVDSSNYGRSNTLQCYSVMAVENKSMSISNFAHKVLQLDRRNLDMNFYSSSRC